MAGIYAGCWTALVTPFNKVLGVDWEQLERNIDFMVEEGLTGVLPMGTTGESATVTHEEHAKIIERVCGYASGKCKVLAGTGSNSTDEAVYETEKAVNCGVDAVLLVDCYYNKPGSLWLRNEYYSVLAKCFPDLDIIPYVIPGRSVTALEPEDLAILRDEYKNIVAVKEATGNFERMIRTRELVDDDFSILSGDDPNTFRMMTDEKIRASGVISVISNITPGPIEEYTRLILDGKIKDAEKIDNALQPLFNVVGISTTEQVTLPDGSKVDVEYKFPNPVPVKTLMNGLGMMESPVKKPLGKLTKKGVKVVRDALAKVWESSPRLLEPVGRFYDVDVGERIEKDEYWKNLSY
ncbi:MAG: 4-hydroxy-tetrahydrodipicolinate synthase [Candidatus Altiarchaeota archaeon]